MVISLVVAVLCLAVGLTVVLVKKEARHLLALALVPLALVPALLVSVIVANDIRMAFADAAFDGRPVFGDLMVKVVSTVFAGRLYSLVLLALVGLLVLRGRGRPFQNVQPRLRALFLPLGPVLALAMALLLGWSEGRLVRTVTLALSLTEGRDPAAAQELKELATGSRSGEPLHITQASDLIGRQIIVLTFGGLLLVVANVELSGMLAAAGWRPPRPGSSHVPALVLVTALAVVGAWSYSGYRRIAPTRAWADAMAESARRRAVVKLQDAAALAESTRRRAVAKLQDAAALARCETGDASACSVVGAPMADADRLALYSRVCRAKGGEVCADLASIHLNGIGTAADLARAKTLYDRACRTGDASACGLFEHLAKTRSP